MSESIATPSPHPARSRRGLSTVVMGSDRDAPEPGKQAPTASGVADSVAEGPRHCRIETVMARRLPKRSRTR